MQKALVLTLAASFVMPAFAFAAPDPLAAAPDMYKLLFEDAHIRIMEVSFKPGQKIAKHTHPHAHYVTVLSPGTLTIFKEDGSSTVNQLKAEQVVNLPAETHWAENTGKTDVTLLVSELKDE